MRSILIYTSATGNKLSYVFDFIFKQQLGLDWSITSDYESFVSSKVELKLCYTSSPKGAYLCIEDSGYFYKFEELNIPEFQATLTFNRSQSSFDLFAVCFYLLARVEEYTGESRDDHGRYQSSSSILSNKNLLEFPVIDNWIRTLQLELERIFPVEFEVSQYEFISTIDVDHLYAFKHKGVFLSVAAVLKDIWKFRLQKILDRPKVDDPYDLFDALIEWHESRSLMPLFFILTSQRGAYDRSLIPQHPEFKKRAQKLAACDLGLHPSYQSNSKKETLLWEKNTLENIVSQTITKSRQHYLRVELPYTYRNLIQAGITDDYSLGYPDRIGFRAGTSHSFLWYDLHADQVSSLRLHPFCMMDVTLKNAHELTPSEAIEKATVVINSTKAVNGQCIIIWHNSSFYEGEGWKGWKEAYLNILDIGLA